MEALENTPETAETTEQLPEAGEKPISLAAALLGESGESPEQAEPGESQAKAKPQEGTPSNLHALAERLGMEAKDLYSLDVQVHVDGEAEPKAVKLGELKDLYAKQDDLTRRELELEARRTKVDADLTRAKSELETLMAGLPKEAIKPEVLERVRKDALESRERERVATLEAIPEWNDEAVRTEELKGIVGLIGDYGYAPEYLQRSLDHRFMRMSRDYWRLKGRVERALAGVKKVEPTSTGKSKPTPPKDKRKPSTLSSRAGNVRALLGE